MGAQYLPVMGGNKGEVFGEWVWVGSCRIVGLVNGGCVVLYTPIMDGSDATSGGEGTMEGTWGLWEGGSVQYSPVMGGGEDTGVEGFEP